MLKLRQLQEQKKRELHLKTATDGRAISATRQISAARIRLQRDIDDLELPPTVSLTICISPTDPSSLDNPLLDVIISPDEGYYKNGHFRFSLEFNDNYPMEPPKVVCRNRIYHPNIDVQGKVCLNILREDWSPALDLQSIIVGLLFLFLEPNAKDPLNTDAAAVFSKDSNAFAKFVRKTMEGYSLNSVSYDYVL
ncbi:hypothetical protein NCAS_0A05940 [Naumovozyma castellii]|uniref:NEDD8-conjugating enzyme UBC12 n=1 Tax=Naumovozyma castellii TaxID=27288 RepID=G0V6Q6_NAUCA|nr:hypothetical protein NCAS_0A05940 [Naumovozyma castellii CBS 4309]CCC67152.1 hypothetical protein NCAS_0A05940 [Naumovozyma castellii CBS 4309]